jgi:DNA-binding MarR family transcriptional regulator
MSGRWRSAIWILCNSSWRWAARVRARLWRSRRVNQAPYSVNTWLNRFGTLGQLPVMGEGPSNSADLAERFENALYSIARGWRHAVDRRLDYIGISVASWMTFAAASHGRSPLSQTELANMIAVSGASMVHMIDRWVKAGLVRQEGKSYRDHRRRPTSLRANKGRGRYRSSTIPGQHRSAVTRASDGPTRATAMHTSAIS